MFLFLYMEYVENKMTHFRMTRMLITSFLQKYEKWMPVTVIEETISY